MERKRFPCTFTTDVKINVDHSITYKREHDFKHTEAHFT